MTNPAGRFGVHGGQYVPEILMNAVKELEDAYEHYKNDPEFNRELSELLNDYAGRPSRLYYAEKMTKDLGGANGNGFTFQSYNADDMLDAIHRAERLYFDSGRWNEAVLNALSCDFSWGRSAKEYVALYEKVLG